VEKINPCMRVDTKGEAVANKTDKTYEKPQKEKRQKTGVQGEYKEL